MSVSVRIPTILRTYTGGESEVSAEGDTLAAVLDDLDASYSGIKGRILDEAGKLRRFVNVYVGNDDVRFLDDLDTPTPGRRADLGDPRRRRRLSPRSRNRSPVRGRRTDHDDDHARPARSPAPAHPRCGRRAGRRGRPPAGAAVRARHQRGPCAVGGVAALAGQGHRRLRRQRPAQLLLRPHRARRDGHPGRPHRPRHPRRPAAEGRPRVVHGRALHPHPQRKGRRRTGSTSSGPAAASPARSRSTRAR